MKFKTDKANSRKKSDLSKDTRRKVQSDDSDKIGLHRSVKQFLLVAFLSIGLITLIYILQIIFFDSHVHKSVDINLGPIKSEDIQQYKQILGEAENLLQDMRAKEQEPYGNPAITNKPVLATVKPDIIQPSHKAMVYDRNNRPMLRGDESHHSVSSNRGSIVLSPYSSVSVSSGNIPNSQNKPKGRRKDLVIGMAQDTDPRNLAVFCGSLRE